MLDEFGCPLSDITVSIVRCQFCKHWGVIDRGLGTCEVRDNDATRRDACCEKWEPDSEFKDEKYGR